MTFKPFKNTTIRAFAENYQDNANRPNGVEPRDLVTPWFQAGRPAYDPTTRMITVLDTGKTYGPYVNTTFSPGYVTNYNTGGGAVNGYFLTAATPANTVVNPQWMNGIYFDDTNRPIRADQWHWPHKHRLLLPAPAVSLRAGADQPRHGYTDTHYLGLDDGDRPAIQRLRPAVELILAQLSFDVGQRHDLYGPSMASPTAAIKIRGHQQEHLQLDEVQRYPDQLDQAARR